MLPDGATAVEFGGIKIYLDYLPEEARRLVLGRRDSRWERFFARSAWRTRAIRRLICALPPTPLMCEAFDLAEPRVLYGRCNVLSDPSRNVLARVVEILPAWNGPADGEGSLG